MLKTTCETANIVASAENGASSTVYLRPEQIIPRPHTKSTVKDQNAIIRLAASIQKYGILEPIAVKTTPKSRGTPLYELIDGEHRYRAALLAGITPIPCTILPEHHRSCALAAILSQLRQESLNFFEQAAAFQMLINDFSLTQEEIARKSGFSQSAIANKLRLLALSKDEQAQILLSKLTERHARAFLRLKSPVTRKEAIFRVRQGKLNVAATEMLIETLILEQEGGEHPNQTGCQHSAPRQIPLPNGEIPRKFALQDLTPLYNSIERSLSILRKTGLSASIRHEEEQSSTRIVIEIPKVAF